jgi:D-serine deaminase-like pyridoxal phosphate-dependent protein
MTGPLDAMRLNNITTPAAIVDVRKMRANIRRMQQRMDLLGVKFRPHVKTTKCVEIVREQLAAGAQGITVSTLKEAEAFFDEGVRDILYAVEVAPAKLAKALELRRKGCDLKLLVDNPASAKTIAQFAAEHEHAFEVWIEIDTDGHRAGAQPGDPVLIEIARALQTEWTRVGGVLAHAGSSYEANSPQALQEIAERERAGCVAAAQAIRNAGITCAAVSVGSTPTALSAPALPGVTEVRAGVYVFFDLVMANTGVCTVDDIALSVLSTVIGHRIDKGWILVDAGWMAMSRDRGTQQQAVDYGYGQVCDLDGRPLDGLVMTQVNQEHGIICDTTAQRDDIEIRFPIGSQVRILPNHACATATQFDRYELVDGGDCIATWSRFHGW